MSKRGQILTLVQLQVRGDFSDEATAQVQSAIESTTPATTETQPQ